MRVGIHEAKTNLSKLIPAVQAGEEVIITKGGRPVARLVPFTEKEGQRPLGLYKGKVTFQGDILEPLPEEVVTDFWPKPADADDLSS
ncbi:MAG: type II toxin-antitoxin system Phd/YefM family antitoxin [Deltaproteobacteria bacterium]|nr:type II toxin-antitoxin system Phd/YefM family antitoxin [Deltaproteobacteria bacterium]